MPRPQFFRLNILSIYLVLLLAGGWLSHSVYKTGNSIEDVSQLLIDEQLPTLYHISELKRWIVEYERILYEFYATTSVSSDDRENIYKKQNLAETQIELNLNKLAQRFNHHSDISQLIQLFDLLKLHAKLIDQALPPAPYSWNEVRDELVIVSQYGRDSLPHLESLTHEIENQVLKSKELSGQQLDNMSKWVMIFASVILLLAILVGYYIRTLGLQDIEKQRLALFVENNPNPVACINYDGLLEFENSSWQKHYPDRDNNEFVGNVFWQIKSMKEQNIDFSQFNLKENKKLLELSIHKIASLRQFMIYVEDVTEQEVSRRELEFLAYHDALTGLPNLKKLDVDLEKLIARGNEHSFCLLSVGVKRLQLITTTHGHSVSDALIKALVMRLQNCLVDVLPTVKKCSIYRFTGAKFEVLIAGNYGLDEYKDVLLTLNEKINQASKKALQTTYGQFFLDIQAGYVLFPEHGYNADILIKNSSSALNEAQKSNSKEIVSFDHELAYREQNWYRLENDIRQANFDSEFFVTYQAKVNLEDTQLVGMEALIRWNHPEKGLVSPAEFIPIAEESGMIIALGEWIMNEAVKQTSEWMRSAKTELQIAVNVSPSQLLSANFVSMVLEILERHQLNGKYLEIEITEEVMVDDKTLCISILEQLKAHGISIAMDDFGTGYSSLAYLNRFPLSKLKIDRSFVTDIHRNQGNLAIVKTILALSESLNIKVIAEGIEVEEELNVLSQLGCHQGQGYLFSKPLDNIEFHNKYIAIS